MALIGERTGEASCRISDGGELVAEIRSLCLVSAKFARGGRTLIGSTVPLRLYWMQYANHEDPERNAASNARLEILEGGIGSVVVECTGTTVSGACASRVVLTLRRSSNAASYLYRIDAELRVLAPSGWIVTRNPDHGELEFANLWPDGAFVTRSGDRKRYQSCLLVGRNGRGQIPHHHLESSDKHLIVMERGDRFLWVVEEENPCLTLESPEEVTAGLCAYMWDAHFAYKVCQEGDVLLPRDARFQARYTLEGIGRDEAVSLLAGAPKRPAPEVSGTPVYVDGVNTFSATLETSGADPSEVWPWEQEGNALFAVDGRRGFDDSHSLRMDLPTRELAAWKATAFGPAYGKPPFSAGCRFRFSARAAGSDLAGEARVAIRLHREGTGDVFELKDYELYRSTGIPTGTSGWNRLEVTTPPISPAPDRLHLRLEGSGPGTVWFDSALLEILP
jgi:hypothetical protein